MSAGPHTEQTSCASCTFYDDGQATPTKAQGLCRHNPPSGGDGATAWPVVSARDWCGQFVFDGHGGRDAREAYAGA